MFTWSRSGWSHTLVGTLTWLLTNRWRPSESNLRLFGKPPNFCGFYLQKPHQVLMMKSWERSPCVWNTGKETVILVKTRDPEHQLLRKWEMEVPAQAVGANRPRLCRLTISGPSTDWMRATFYTQPANAHADRFQKRAHRCPQRQCFISCLGIPEPVQVDI